MQDAASLRFVAHDTAGHDFYVPTDLVSKNIHTACRICDSKKIIKRGEVEFYLDYAWPIYDCDDCGCRFTPHESSTYDLLYSERSSCYSRYTSQAQTCKTL